MLRHLMSGVALAAVVFGAGPGLAQDFSAERLSDGIRIISADDFEGREPGTIGEEKTLAWLQAQYEAMGLQPGGPDGQWLQPVDLLRFTPDRPPTGSWSGPQGVQTLTPGADFTARAYAPSGTVSIENAPVVFIGYGISAPERAWDDYGDIDLTGKVVLALAGEPDTELFKNAVPTLYGTAGYKMDEARRRGAVGLITVVPQDAIDSRWTGRAQGATRQRTTIGGHVPVAFTGSVNQDVAQAMLAASGQSLSFLIDNAERDAFTAVELTGVTLSLDIAERTETTRTHNLLARIPGTERPDETLIFSAHWDHVGKADAPDEDGDDVFNGAWDNGSGTVALVEMARQLKAAPAPERSIVFLHATSEELGLLGGYWYAEHPVYPLATTVADFNIDMIPLSAPTRDLPIFGYGQNTLEDELQALASVEGRTVTDDGQPNRGFYYRSDHFPFARGGVPALMTWHGVDLDEGGKAVGLPAYRAKFSADYHRLSDEWSADWNLDAAIEDLTLLYKLSLDLANSDRWPSWKADSEFAAVRAATDDQRR